MFTEVDEQAKWSELKIDPLYVAQHFMHHCTETNFIHQ